MAKLGDLIVRVGADTRGLNKSLGNAKKQMRETTGNLTQMGKSLSMSLTAPLLGIGALAVKAASEFEFSMAKVQAVSGFTAAEMDNLEAQAQELGASTSKSASDVASLQLELAKLGKTSTEIEQMTEGVLSLSVAFDTELGETARVVGATLNQFGLEASESGRIVDNMAVLFGSSALDLEKFDAAMRTVGPTASDMGLSVEEAGAALGVLVNAGVDASTAGTALTKSLVTLAKEGMTGKEAIDALTTGQLNTAQAFEVFGDRAGKVIPILQKSSEKYAELTEKQIEGTGAALKARKILEDTAQGGFDRLRSAVEALGISLGDALLPMVKQMTDAVAGFASKLAGMSDGAKTAVIVVGAMAAAIGPLLIILPHLVNGIKLVRLAQLKLNAAIFANPYVAAAAAVVALSAAVYIFATRATEAEKIQKKLAGVSKKIEENYAKEASSMEFLRFQYKEAGDDLEKRKDLLEQIAVISPETVKDLDAETLSYDDLSTAIDGYLIKLKDKIRIQMGEEAITAALQKQIELEIERDRLSEQINKQKTQQLLDVQKAEQRVQKAKEDGSGWELNAARLERSNAKFRLNDKDDLWYAQNRNNKALEANATLIEGLTQTYGENASATSGVSRGLGKVADSADDAETSVKALSNELDISFDNIDLNEAFFGKNDDLNIEPFFDELEGDIDDGTDAMIANFQELKDAATNAMMKAAEVSSFFGNAFGSAVADVVSGEKTAGQALKSLALNAIRALIGMAKANVIANATSPTNAVNLLSGGLSSPAFIVAGLSMLEGFIGGIAAFKDGGIVSGPTLGLVGEYPGASTNPEVIAPLDKLRSMMGGQNVVVTGKISGRDILLTSERNAIDRNRVRGF